MNKISIHYITNTTGGQFVGDANQAIAIAIELQQELGEESATCAHWGLHDIANLRAEIHTKKDEEHIIIAIGSHGITAIDILVPQFKYSASSKVPAPKPIIIWAGHQEFPGLERVREVVDFIALPQHVVAMRLRIPFSSDPYRDCHAKLIATTGVAHNVTKGSLQAALTTDLKLPDADKYTGVFLGGDASDSNDVKRYFTADEAEALAHHIYSNEQNMGSYLLVTNCPRTGKYNSDTTEEYTHLHLEGCEEIDLVTDRFLKTLDRLGLPYHFSNFLFGAPSAYKPYLAKVQQTDGLCYVTGESTSMISEMCDNITPSNLYIMQVGSMNAAHHEHVNCYRGKVNILSAEGGVSLISKTEKEGMPSLQHESAARHIARVLGIYYRNLYPIDNSFNEGAALHKLSFR